MVTTISLRRTPILEVEDGDTILVNAEDDPREVASVDLTSDYDLFDSYVVTFTDGTVALVELDGEVYVEVED